MTTELQTAASQAALSTTPADLLRMAVQGGADIDKLEKLMQLQERWEQNEARKRFNEAFSAFKAESVVILKNKMVQAGPLKGGKHADLAEVVGATTPALSKHGLAISWRLTKDEKTWIEVTCTLRHQAGHFESVSMGGEPDAGPGRNAMQARGSTKTYLERYTATAILGLAAQDDDGNGGEKRDLLDERHPLLDEGRDVAMQGTAALREWWAAQTETARLAVAPHFKSMKAAAELADKATA